MSSTSPARTSPVDDDAKRQPERAGRLQRACNVCRRRKIKCDAVDMPGQRCSACIACNTKCTRGDGTARQLTRKGYVEDLQNRLAIMERLVEQFTSQPSPNHSASPGSPEQGLISTQAPRKLTPSNQSHIPDQTILRPVAPSAISDSPRSNNEEEDEYDSSDDETMRPTLVRELRDHTLDLFLPRYFGKSSTYHLTTAAFNARHDYATGQGASTEDIYSRSQGAHRETRPNIATVKARLIKRGEMRPEFWYAHPFEVAASATQVPKYDFPPVDLMTQLISRCFEEIGLFFPILHRAQFEDSVRRGLHRHDPDFGAVVLLVCALGAKYSTDPRVYINPARDGRYPQQGGTHHSHMDESSKGWMWFNQVQLLHKPMIVQTNLYELQAYCLSSIFLSSVYQMQASWTTVGIGLRLAQDVGAHRRKSYSEQCTTEDELWKRAFWCLVIMDRQLSCILGRPCAMQAEDIDADLPIDCDDDNWRAYGIVTADLQGDVIPKVSCFISMIKLGEISAYALRTLYSTRKAKSLLNAANSDADTVTELDSALNSWHESLPEHLRWDPGMDDVRFLHQSATLHASYYYARILIHRPFISTIRHPVASPFPSLSICINAAKCTSGVLEAYSRRLSHRGNPVHITAAFASGVILLLNILNMRLQSVDRDLDEHFVPVDKCMHFLRSCELLWPMGGRFWDILNDMACIARLPVRSSPPIPGDSASNAPIVARPVVAAIDQPQVVPLYPFDPAYVAVPGTEATQTNAVTVGEPAIWPQTIQSAALPVTTSFEPITSGANMLRDVQPAYLSTFTGQTRDVWGSVPQGFGFADWHSYVTSTRK